MTSHSLPASFEVTWSDDDTRVLESKWEHVPDDMKAVESMESVIPWRRKPPAVLEGVQLKVGEYALRKEWVHRGNPSFSGHDEGPSIELTLVTSIDHDAGTYSGTVFDCIKYYNTDSKCLTSKWQQDKRTSLSLQPEVVTRTSLPQHQVVVCFPDLKSQPNTPSKTIPANARKTAAAALTADPKYNDYFKNKTHLYSYN